MFFSCSTRKLGKMPIFDDHIFFQKRVGSTTKTKMFLVQSYVKRDQRFLEKNPGASSVRPLEAPSLRGPCSFANAWLLPCVKPPRPRRWSFSLGGSGGGVIFGDDWNVQFLQVESILFFWKLEFWMGYIYICIYFCIHIYIYTSQENSRNLHLTGSSW